MNPEKEIINWWLNKNGYFTVNSIKVAQNKEIDILAIKFGTGRVRNILHIETACSISSVDNISPSQHARKLNDALIEKKVKGVIREHVGEDAPYQKTLIIGATSRTEDFNKLSEIQIIKFSKILFEVFNDLDKQNYRNDVIRSLQLIKYLLISKPILLAKLLEKQDQNKILKQNTRADFLRELLLQKETRRILEKEENEHVIVEVLKNSSLSRPEKFARILEEEVFGKRTRKKFLEEMLKQENIRSDIRKTLKKKEKSLLSFFG